MPRYALLFCAGVITGALAQGGGLSGNVRLVAHTDSNIRYSSVANGLGHAECTRVPSPCAGKWWSENNEGGTASLVRTRHATTGPGSSLSFTFSGSRQLILGGKRDSSVSASVLLNGAPYPLSGDTDSLIFSTNSLNPSTTYNVVLTYGGHGTLGFAGFAVDKNARVSQGGQEPPTQPPGPTQLPAPTLQPAPSSPDEPTRTPPAQDPKPSDTTVISGGGGSPTASPAPDPSPDPAEPTNSPGAHDGASPSNTRSVPAPSETASAPDNGNSNAVTPPPDDGTDDSGQPGNAGAGSPQEGKNRMNTGAIAGGVIAGLLALIVLGALAAWYARRRVRARRAPSYAFRHGPGEFAPTPHWTPPRAASPQPEMAEKPLP